MLEPMADDSRPKGADPEAGAAVDASLGRFGATVLAERVTAGARNARPPREVAIGRFVGLDVLGTGGMGIVYSASDPDLDRKVALKLTAGDLPGNVRARLLREAQAMARIDHPNVIKVYEVGTHADGVYVAMELAKAGTLRSWLKHKPRTQREVIGVFAQAGRGLVAAHSVGLIHRDFKPDNVLMTTHETAKVSDFGLVVEQDEQEVARSGAAPTEIASHATPLSLKLTRTGAVMGTPTYMAPEQFRGEIATARTDQFAFCVALCEALYGQRPFSGSTFERLAANVLAGRVMTRPATAPAWLWRIIARGLAGDPAARFPSMDALLAELARDRSRRRRRLLAAAGAAAAIVSAGAIVATRESHAPEVAMVVRSIRNLTGEPGCEEYPSFTPDGREIVFDGVIDNDIELQAIAIDSGARRRLTNSPGWDLGAVVSPDGRHVAYVHAGRELRVVGIEGDAAAPPRTIAPLRGFPTWARNGDLLYCGVDGQIWRAPLDGSPTSVARLPTDHIAYFIDEFPDGELVLAIRSRAQTSSALAMAHARPGGVAEPYAPPWETLDSSYVRVDADGRGVYYVAPTPSGLPKLHWRARAGGEPVVLEGTQPMTNSFAVARSGRQLVFSTCDSKQLVGRIRAAGFESLAGLRADWNPSTFATLPGDGLIVTAFRSADSEPHLWKVTPGGGEQVVAAPAKHPAVSADGEQLAWSGLAPAPGIYVRAMAGGATRRLTDHDDDENPAFSHDGARVLFSRGGRVHAVPVAGGPEVAVTPPGVVAFAAAPDRALLGVVFDERGRRVVRTGPPGGPFRDVEGLAERRYDQIVFDGTGWLLGTPAGLDEVRADGTVRPLWSSTIDTLGQVARSRAGGDPWAVVTDYDGDLALIDGVFP
jgi:hypothetical protein